MAHNIQNGEMMSVRARPWHGLGTILADYPTADEAIVAAKLDWQVTLEPIFTADMKEIDGYKRTVRADNGKTLGVVGSRFHVIQNRSLFDLGEAIIAVGEQREDGTVVTAPAKWETAGALFGGERVWILAKLDRDLYVAGEKIDPYFVLTHGHDGRHAMIAKVTPIRVVCNNTLTAAVGNGKRKRPGPAEKGCYVIPHLSGYEKHIAEARKTLGFVQKYYVSWETFVNGLVEKKMAKAAFEDFLKDLVPMGEDPSKRKITEVNALRESLIACYNAPDLENIRETAWGAYNAVADYSDHHRGLREDDRAADRAYVRTFEDTPLKDKALDLLVAYN